MPRVLITGGAGFIGANLIERIHDNYDIVVLDNESLGKRENIAEFGVNFIQGDITEVADLDRALEGVDKVVHLAADTRVMDSIADPELNFQTNVVGSFKLLQACRARGIEAVVNASTGGAIIGEAEPPVHEEMPARPTAPYGASKLSVEGYCSAFNSAYGMKIVSLRFSNVYGPRAFHKASAVHHFYKRILAAEPITVYGDGSQTRDFVFAGDIAEAIHLALEVKEGGVYQLGTGGGTNLNDLLALMREVVGPEHAFDVIYKDFRAGEVKNTWCDISKAERELGYAPVVTLQEGLSRTWEWFREYYRDRQAA